MIVLDSSYALALAFPDENPPRSREQVLEQPLIAPHVFPVEVANAALNSVRRRRCLPRDAERICQVIEALAVAIELPPMVAPAFHLRMALAHGLTAYDAMYLDLAQVRRSPLATCDAALAAAARKAGIEVLS
ncbi:MAG: type II toxin-antitoxin system VapC family toxin [Aquabacterium sp.]|nr:type II toxin-antitoxin system VapC family toxin [Aquabacterium sp.]